CTRASRSIRLPFPSTATSDRTSPSPAPSELRSTPPRLSPLLLGRRSALQTSPGITAYGSDCAPAPTLPPAFQTAPPDARMLPALLPLRAVSTPRNSAHRSPPCAAPACSQRIQSTPPLPPACGPRSVFLSPHSSARCSDTTRS